MLKKLLAGLTAIALSLGMVALTAGPATATPKPPAITATVACTSPTSATITWSVQNWNDEKKGKVVSSTGNIVPADTEFEPSETKQFVQNVTTTGDYELSVTMKWRHDHQWKDQQAQTKEGSIKVESGVFDKCKPQNPVVTDPTPYVLVAWKMPSWINSTTPTWSQTFFAKADLATKDLNALDGQLGACGTQYQVDLYKDSATTTALIAGGVLYGPNNPAEDFPSPSGWGKTYKLIQNLACEEEEPTEVSGSVTSADESCTVEYETVSGWIEPVATTGVVYELYASDKTTLLDGTFDAKTDLPAGTYWVKVVSTDPALYTVSDANTWIEVTVGAYDGYCAEPESVSGSVVAADESCTVEYETVSGWIEPVATTGVVYELYASDKTTLLDGTFDAKTDLPAGTYWVKVVSTDPALYTVSDANTWIEVTVGAYDGKCAPQYVEVIGDPFDFQECVPDGELSLTSTWVATLTIDTADTEPTGSVQYRVFVWDGTDWVDEGIWPDGVYTAGPGGDFPYTQVKVVAEAVSPYIIKDGTQTEWVFDFPEPLDCNLPDFGIVAPVVTFAATCSATPTYTLAITGGVQGTVLWSVDGGPQTTQLGTFAAPGKTVTVVATPAPGSGFDGDGLPRTFTKTFGSAEVCGDLTTLALTGGDLSGPLAVTALLGLLGAVLIRAGRHLGRGALQG